MKEIKLRVPSRKEECNIYSGCVKVWVIGTDRMKSESCTFGNETSKVTYEDVKESVRELEEQKKKVERLQEEFIEQALKDNVSPSFLGYTLDIKKGMSLLYEIPVSVYPFIDKNTFVFQKDDKEIIKVRLPEAEDSSFATPHTIYEVL